VRPGRARLLVCPLLAQTWEFQLTRTWRDVQMRPGVLFAGVSIHAPVMGATWRSRRESEKFRVSIHAPVKARLRYLRTGASIWCCNSRAREGRDELSDFLGHLERGFNLRARGGRDQDKVGNEGMARCFNSRAREGRDRLPQFWNSSCFNLRAHEGRDNKYGYPSDLQEVSIPAPMKGATAC